MTAPKPVGPLDDPSVRGVDAPLAAVKVTLTPRQLQKIVDRQAKTIEKLQAVIANRPTKRPRREVETMEYISAARRFIRSAGARVADSDEYELRALIELRPDLDEAIRTAVQGQRDVGRSWAYIASATGTTRQAAFQKWSKPNDTAI